MREAIFERTVRSMIEDYEEASLARQDWRDIMEDADDLGDDCSNCKMLELCQQAADSHGMYPFPACPHERGI